MKFPFDEALSEARSLRWAPRADIYRTPTGWLVKFDLAGIQPQDISVEVRGSTLRVAGVRRDRFVERGFRHHSMEISYSRFERTIRLPCAAEGASIATDYSEGMLIVTVDTEESTS